MIAVATGHAGVMYVSYGDRTGYSRPNIIEKFDLATGADLGVFANTGLSLPTGLALDSAGNLYVANYGNSTITKFTPSGAGSVFASTGLNGPESLAFDSAGNLYVANYCDRRQRCQPRRRTRSVEILRTSDMPESLDFIKFWNTVRLGGYFNRTKVTL